MLPKIRPVFGYGVLVHIAHILALLGAFSGRFSDISWSALEGPRGLFDTPKSSRTCGVATVSLYLGASPRFGGYFVRKMAIFGPKLRRFGRPPPDRAPPPRAATGEFVAQNLDLARPAAPRLQDSYIGKRSEAFGRSNGRNGMDVWLLVACCCCCLLATFKGRRVY